MSTTNKTAAKIHLGRGRSRQNPLRGKERRPVQRRLRLHGLDGGQREIEATCFPLIGQADRFLGAVAMFWEAQQ